jgi:hypothetical protein
MNDTQRKADLDFHKNRGNHKSSILYHEVMDRLITEDIKRGFSLPLPISCLNKIPNASLAPLGCQRQSTIDEKGHIIPKYHITHDQTFPGPSGLSVNLRVQKELLPLILYSFIISRLIHYIVSLQL